MARHHKSTSLIGAAILKYGIKNFKREILQECKSYDEMNEAERQWIDKFNTITPNGYNLQHGGLNAPKSEHSKRLLSAFHTGRPAHPNAFKGLRIGWNLPASERPSVKGTLNGNALLTEAQVLEIRRLYQQRGLSQTEIGKRFGVKQRTVSDIVVRKLWKHI